MGFYMCCTECKTVVHVLASGVIGNTEVISEFMLDIVIPPLNTVYKLERN